MDAREIKLNGVYSSGLQEDLCAAASINRDLFTLLEKQKKVFEALRTSGAISNRLAFIGCRECSNVAITLHDDGTFSINAEETPSPQIKADEKGE